MNITDYLRSAPVKGHKSDHVSVYYTCPRCGAGRKMEVHPIKRLWHCHRCKAGGRLDGLAEVNRPRPVPAAAFNPETYTPAQPGGLQWRYLRSRGYTDDLIRELKPYVGPHLLRVYLPVFHPAHADPVYMIGRAIADVVDPKYLNPRMEEFPARRNEIVWGLHRFTRPQETVVVCEGILDAVWGPNRVATLGKQVSERQAQIIASLATKEIILMPDGDAIVDAYLTARKLILFWGGRISLITLAYGTDPGGLGPDGEKWIRRRRYL